MSTPNDIKLRSEEIQTLVATNDIKPAIKRLMDFARDFSKDDRHLDEVIVLSAEYHDLETARRRENIDYQTATKEKRKLLFTAFELMRTIIQDLRVEVMADA